MNFNQWKIEMRNNASVLSDYANTIKHRSPDKITQSDIKRLFDYVQALNEMYANLRGVTN